MTKEERDKIIENNQQDPIIRIAKQALAIRNSLSPQQLAESLARITQTTGVKL